MAGIFLEHRRFHIGSLASDEEMPFFCQNCGSAAFRLRQAADGPEAQCVRCGGIIPNSAVRAASALSSGSEKLDQVQLAAQEMIRLYGKDAARQAARRAGDELAAGNVEQTQLWLAVIGTLVNR